MSGQIVVDQESAGTITSSPGFKKFLVTGFANAAIANKLADDPELDITPYWAPAYLAYCVSNARTFFPMVVKVDSMVSTAANTSSPSVVGSCSLIVGLLGLN